MNRYLLLATTLGALVGCTDSERDLGPRPSSRADGGLGARPDAGPSLTDGGPGDHRDLQV